MATVYEPTEEMKTALNSGVDPFTIRVMYYDRYAQWGVMPPEWVISVQVVTERTGLFGTVREAVVTLDNTNHQAEHPRAVDGVIVDDPENGEWSVTRRVALMCDFAGIEDSLCWMIGRVADSGVRREICLNGEYLLHVTVWDWGAYLQRKPVVTSGRVRILTEKPALANTNSILSDLQGRAIANPIQCRSPVSYPVGPVVLRRSRSVWEEMNNLADTFWAGLYYNGAEELIVVNSPYDGNPGDPEYDTTIYDWVDHPADEIDASLIMSDASNVGEISNMVWSRTQYIGVDWQRYSVDSSKRELWRLTENYNFAGGYAGAYINLPSSLRAKIANDEFLYMCMFRKPGDRPIVGAIDVDDTATIKANAVTDPVSEVITVETGGDLYGERSDDWLQVRVFAEYPVDEAWLRDLVINGKPVYDEGITSFGRAAVDDGDMGVAQRFHTQYATHETVYSDQDITVTQVGNLAYR